MALPRNRRTKTPVHSTVEPLEKRFAPASVAQLSGTQLQISVDGAVGLVRSGTNLLLDLDGNGTPDAVYGLAQFNEIAMTGGSGPDQVSLDLSGGDFIPTLGLHFDGGTGTDGLHVQGDTDFYVSGNIVDITGHGRVDLNAVEGLDFKGGLGANLLSATLFDGTIQYDGLGGNDTVEILGSGTFHAESGSAVVGGQTVQFSNVEGLSLIGSANSDRFVMGSYHGAATINGSSGLGTDTVEVSADANFVLSSAQLSVSDRSPIVLRGIESAVLTGGAGDNRFEITDFDGPVTIAGGAGTDLLVRSVASDATLTNSSLILTGTGIISHSGIERAELDGNSAANRLDASAFNGPVTLVGGEGNDVLIGGVGNDFLTGGLGNDSLVGGSGIDTLSESADVDFSLYAGQLRGLGTDTIFGIENILLTGGVSGNDFLVDGWAGNVTVAGGNGNDSLEVTGGSHFMLNAGSIAVDNAIFVTPTGVEAVTVRGESTNDQFVLNGWTGAITVNGGSGVDSFFAQVPQNAVLTKTDLTLTGQAPITLTSIAYVELTGSDLANFIDTNLFTSGSVKLVGNGGNDTLIGGLGNDCLIGGDGEDSLVGNEGHDSLSGGAGNDVLNGGANTDAFIETIDGSFKLTSGSNGNPDVAYGLGTDLLVGIERAELTGGAGNDLIDASGFNGTAILVGGPGNDTLFGGSGDDSLYDDQGDDWLIGGTGNDTYYLVGLGNNVVIDTGGRDVLDLSGANSPAYLNLAVQIYAQNTFSGSTLRIWGAFEKVIGTVSGDTLIGGAGNESLVGGFGNDILMGGGGNDTLDGGYDNDLVWGDAGDDLLIGGPGDDLFVGGPGNDTVKETADVNFTLTQNTLTGVGTDLYLGVEQFDLTGGPSANIFDTRGFFGIAHISGLGGDDTLLAGFGSEKFNGGTGFDVIDYSWFPIGISANLETGVINGQGIDNVTAVEGIVGSNVNDIIVGSHLADKISGGGGNDIILGAAGNDTIDGGDGNDWILGGDGDDSISGGAGADLIDGGAGNDILHGDAGDDNLAGGLGDDTLDGGDGIDILDGGDGTDIALNGETVLNIP